MQYLLDQVSRLTSENAMLKEKWLSQPEQEPVAWMWDEMFCDDWTTVSSVIKPSKSKYVANVRPLYTSLPKREPLTLQQIIEGNPSMLNVTREESNLMPILCDMCNKEPLLAEEVKKSHWLERLSPEEPNENSFLFVESKNKILVSCAPCFFNFYEENFIKRYSNRQKNRK